MNKSVMKAIKSKFAFTLAETLIVVGLIGVVAALTLTNLSSSTDDLAKVAKLKKAYSDLSTALDRAVLKYGDYTSWTAASGNPYAGKIIKYMNVKKDCGSTNNAGCFSTSKMGDGSDSLDSSNNNFVPYRIVSADGISYLFDCFIVCWVYVDIDGPVKGANSFGDDIFGFQFGNANNQKGIFPLGTDANCIKNKNYDCSSWVIYHENLDYLYADKNGKCKNGKTILNGTSNITCY